MSDKLMHRNDAAMVADEARIQDPEAEQMFVALMQELISAHQKVAWISRDSGDQQKADYYQGRADSYRDALKHYGELR